MMVRERTGSVVECGNCKGNYYVPACRVGKSKFCSKKCFDEAQTGERKTIKCKQCKTEFVAKKDHGAWQKFCSIKCRDANAVQPEWRECKSCGAKFLAGRSNKTEDGLRKYCSKKCASEALIKSFEKICLNCGKGFLVSPSQDRNANINCCSKECSKNFYVNNRAPGWKGGKYLDKTANMIRVLQRRPGYTSPYAGEHRVIASRSIGRLLTRREPILHINSNNLDNRVENLFICGSISEMRKRFKGLMPWPKKSNLDSYK